MFRNESIILKAVGAMNIHGQKKWMPVSPFFHTKGCQNIPDISAKSTFELYNG